MTSPRHEVVVKDKPGYYHCFSRCVRRAFLCGFDKLSGRSFEHRRQWIETRLGFLQTVFAIELVAYAVMDNHAHDIVRTRPDLAAEWSPEEVARRWRILFPKKRRKSAGSPVTTTPDEHEIRELVAQPKRIEVLRERLSSISWFHRCLNEHIARKANAEDECSGRFWEGRFRSERLETPEAVIACGVYVDLNPIRARIAATPETSAYTSVRTRILALERKETVQQLPTLLPVEEFSGSLLSTLEYLQLVDETGRVVKEGKGSISLELAPLLDRLALCRDHWLTVTTQKHTLFRRFIGPVDALQRAAQRIGKRWVHGISSARKVFS